MHQKIKLILEIMQKIRKTIDKRDYVLHTTYSLESYQVKVYLPNIFGKIYSYLNLSEINIGEKYFYNPLICGNNSKLIFHTEDHRYIIKIINNNEFNTLIKFLEKYCQYVYLNPNTYLTKILGCYEIIETLSTTKFIIMENIFEHLNLESIYDIKGLGLNRFSNGLIKKEGDWILENGKIYETNREEILNQLDSDCEFLKENNIMDYSLVIGAESIQNEKSLHSVFQPKKKYAYALIDILTSYNFNKKIESLFYLCCLCSSNKSCCNPLSYKSRLMEMVKEKVFDNDTKTAISKL